MNLIYYYVAGVILIFGLIFKFFFGRSYFNKHKYVRLVRYNEDKSITIDFIKKQKFNQNKELLINPDNVFNFSGYTTIVTTSQSNESINPLNFESKFNPSDYKSAIRSKLIKDTFQGLQPERFDKLMILIIMNGLTLVALIYLLYNLLGGGK